jgi:hypothetical protein
MKTLVYLFGIILASTFISGDGVANTERTGTAFELELRNADRIVRFTGIRKGGETGILEIQYRAGGEKARKPLSRKNLRELGLIIDRAIQTRAEGDTANCGENYVRARGATASWQGCFDSKQSPRLAELEKVARSLLYY